MSSFTPTSKRLACDICGDTSGKCRVHKGGEILLCMPFSNARFGEIQNGYKCIKEDKGKGWSTWKIDNTQEWTQQQRQEWKQRLEARRRQQAKQDEARASRALSERQKHEQYQKMLAELDLHPDDRADLIRRGFTNEQIELAGFKSVENWQRLKGKYSHLLPGIGIGGKRLLTGKGYLCPIRNAQGLIVACQIRLREVKSGEGRYRYLSSVTKKNPSGQSPHLYRKGFEPELPLAIHKPPGEPKGIALAEGVGAKPFLASQRLGLIVVGAAGGQWAGSLNQLKETLKLCPNATEIPILADAGSVANPAVCNQYFRAAELLQEWGYTPVFAWWNQVLKDDPDIDELPSERYSEIEYLSLDEFKHLASEHGGAESKHEQGKLRYFWRQWKRLRQFTPTHTVNQRYFKFPRDLKLEGSIVAAKSALGTGKTSAFLQLIAESGMGVRLIGYRNNLLHQTVSRAKTEAGLNFYHLQSDDAFLFLKDKDSLITFCLDSISHSQPHWYEGTIIVLDETVSVLFHGISGGTLGDRQSKCLSVLREALKACAAVVCLDGNLRDIDIELIEKLAENKKVIKIQNEFKPDPHNITFVRGIDPEGELKRQDRSPLLKAMSREDCIPWIVTDALGKSKVFYEFLSSQGQKGFVLNSETVGEPWAVEFLANPSAFIAKYKPDFFIASPSAESGLDCHGNGHFTHKFSFFVGVLNTNAQNQIMFRLRDNLPHYVFCPDRGRVKDRNIPTTYSVNEYKKQLEAFNQLNAGLAAEASNSVEIVEGVVRLSLQNADPDYFKYSTTLGAFDNFEINNLRECLISSLRESGHRVIEADWESEPELAGIESEIFGELQRQQASETFQAKKYEEIEEARKLKRKTVPLETKRRIEKTFFLDRLPGIEESSIWESPVSSDPETGLPIISKPGGTGIAGGEKLILMNLKNRHFLTGLERLYLLQNFHIAQKRHEKLWNGLCADYLTKEEAARRGGKFATVWALRELNILQFFEREWTADSFEIIELEKAGHRPDIVLALGFSPGKERKGNPQRIDYLRKLLSLVSCRLDSPVQRGEKRARHYQVLKDFKGSNYLEKLVKQDKTIPEESWVYDWGNPLRLATAEAIEKRFNKWWAENSSSIKWVEEQCTSRITETQSQVDADLKFLHQVQDWTEVVMPQERFDEAWQLLERAQRNRLNHLYQQYLEGQKQQVVQETENQISKCDPEMIEQSQPEIKIGSVFQRWCDYLERIVSYTVEVIEDQYVGFTDGCWEAIATLLSDYQLVS
ncbi:MAG: hypothetical protein F6J86_16895 [Symploca sp. SIO1B1]|nr:hypothetical protein [Symploca sp. SIO1B1]